MNNHLSPTFDTPPVVETALSIQFDELPGFRSVHFGLFYESIKDQFSEVIDQPRLDPVFEVFPFNARPPVMKFTHDTGGPGRVWFRESADRCLMLQLQPDRFALNWCKKQEVAYPRYAVNCPKLFEEFDRFAAFVVEHNLGELSPNLCEATYVNAIFPEEGETASECFGKAFSGLSWTSNDGWLSDIPSAATFNRVFTIGEQKGRLYVEAGIARGLRNGKQSEFVSLKITARVIHRNCDNLKTNMDLAHEWVVRSFVSLTNESFRVERWNQKND